METALVRVNYETLEWTKSKVVAIAPRGGQAIRGLRKGKM